MARSYGAMTPAGDLVDDLAHEIRGKVILTTGVSPGNLGATFVENVSRAQPALMILASRDTTKLQRTADAIATKASHVKVRLLQLDLGSLAAVRECASKVNAWDDVPCVDVLVNNAGIMATDFALSPDGFESQLATNHLGHFLFANLIMDKLLAAESPRIVNVSSDGHRLNPIRWGDYNFGRGETYNKWRAYGQSKTANVLMAISLAERLGPKQGLLSFSLHPGVTMTTSLATHLDWTVDLDTLSKSQISPSHSFANICQEAVDKEMGNAEAWADFALKSPEQAAATHVYAAFEPSIAAHNGAYLLDSHVADPWKDTVKPWATSRVEAERLWKLSEELVGQRFDY